MPIGQRLVVDDQGDDAPGAPLLPPDAPDPALADGVALTVRTGDGFAVAARPPQWYDQRRASALAAPFATRPTPRTERP